MLLREDGHQGSLHGSAVGLVFEQGARLFAPFLIRLTNTHEFFGQ